jgi:pyruvate/2-oxoglutarate dehydrogenase complex dihydrolipoamide dehydrogenase (E3) component
MESTVQYWRSVWMELEPRDPAVGETFDPDFCRASGLELKEQGTIKVDRFTLETSRPGFYAGGDVITGARMCRMP